MSTAPALRLAGDIAAQFRHLPEAEAADRVAHHIRLFWDPRLQTQLQEVVAAAGSDVDPVVARTASLIVPTSP